MAKMYGGNQKMNENEIELFVKVALNLLGAIKDECEGNCNSCLLKKDRCLFEEMPSYWDLDLIEKQIRKIIEIESKIKGDQKNE